jgi:hypothetical protein
MTPTRAIFRHLLFALLIGTVVRAESAAPAPETLSVSSEMRKLVRADAAAIVAKCADETKQAPQPNAGALVTMAPMVVTARTKPVVLGHPSDAVSIIENGAPLIKSLGPFELKFKYNAEHKGWDILSLKW